ncbi:MAG: ABC transporter substrate-binding protein, partial [Caulobacterales bacterium]|nr:ABC transporter substrate-binding protein [Caulobacterales bacterium]
MRTGPNALTWFVALGASVWLSAPWAPVCAEPNEPLTVNWYHGKEFFYPIARAFELETGVDVQMSDSYDLFDTDVILVADYLTLHQAAAEGRFATIATPERDARVPAQWRDDEGRWYGVAVRLRAAIYNPLAVDGANLRSVYDLADDRFRGRMCLRSGENEYNRSLLASLIVQDGPERAQEWARGVRENAGAAPDYDGDIANILRVADGVCDGRFVNTYYLGHMMSGQRPERYPFTAEDVNTFFEAARKVEIAWLDQETRGNPANVTAVAISSETERVEDAQRFVDFLLSDQGQRMLAERVYKYPVVPGAAWTDFLKSQGRVRIDDFDLSQLDDAYDKADA